MKVTKHSLAPFALVSSTQVSSAIRTLTDNGYDPAENFARLMQAHDATAMVSPTGAEAVLLFPDRINLALRIRDTEIDIDDAMSVACYLTDRCDDHSQAIHGGGELGKWIASLADPSPSTQTSKTDRSTIWRGIPYVFSFFFVPVANPTKLATNELRFIQTLLFPAAIGGLDDYSGEHQDLETMAEEISALKAEDMPVSALADMDSDPSVAAFSSWATVVVAYRAGLNQDRLAAIRNLYTRLEIRIQRLWSVANYLACWGSAYCRAPAMPYRDLLDFESRTLYRLKTDRLLDEDTERCRFIYEELCRTSVVDIEVQKAIDVIDVCQRVNDWRMAERANRVGVATEILMGVLAVSSAAELIVGLPLVNTSRPVALVILLVAIGCLAVASIRRAMIR